MSDNTNVARMPAKQPDKFDIDFPGLMMLSVEKGLDPQVIVTMFQGEIERRQREALDLVKADIYADMLPVLKDGLNKHLGNRYTTIPAMMAMLQPILKAYGVFVGFDVGVLPGEPPVADGYIRVRIVVSYRGYSDRSSYIDEPISRGGVRGGVTQMNDQQAITSATTYGARTLLKLKFNVLGVDDDDDAEGARETSEQQRQRTADARRETDEASRRQVAAIGRFPNFESRLKKVETRAQLDALLGHEKIIAFRAGQTVADQALIDDLIIARRAELPEPTPSDLDLDEPGETVTDAVARQTESENNAGALIARVNVCHTPDEVKQLMTAPDFTATLVKLTPDDGDAVTQAIKRRITQLGGEA
jgi:ERF superfamily